ncbi:putative Glutamine repeat protein-1 [Seiridium cardinale]|uniref:Glutamine repeat protein-1 n=1 Tax=Seiridium cardinale TaxID=138064 RepID=A0ABR2X945_9PEZI
MYAANYGFPNGAPPSQNPQMPGQGPNPNQQPQQQQMMYNPQQFPMAAQGGAFPGNPNVNMMPGAGPAGGMMQNAGMPHMAAANGQSKLEISPTHPLRVACRNRAASYFPPWSPSAACESVSVLRGLPMAAWRHEGGGGGGPQPRNNLQKPPR